MTHWEHINKAIIETLGDNVNRINQITKWSKKGEMISLLNDTFNSLEVFTETGYLSTVSSFPENEKELYTEVIDSFGLILEFGACHMVS